MPIRFRPHESLSHITKVLRQYLHLPDPQVLYVVLGTVAGNHLPGPPIWTMLIGGPSTGGSTMLNALLGYTDFTTGDLLVPQVRHTYGLDSVKGEAAFLSGTARKDKAKDATGGVLKQIEHAGGHGLLVMSDFTNILNLRPEQLNEVVACLRMVYDGKFYRAVGTEGARMLKWQGKVGCITKSTGAIESHHGIMGEMGQRFIMWRYTTTRGHSENLKALAVRSKAEMDIAIATVISEHLNHTLDIVDKGNIDFELEVYESQWTNLAAQFICRARSVVKRDKYKSDIVEFIPPPEGPTRLTQELKSLFLGMQAAGVEDTDAHKALTSMLWGSIQAVRGLTLRVVVNILRDKGAPYARNSFNSDEIDKGMDVQAGINTYRMASPTTIKRTMEDIEHLGMIRRTAGRRGKRLEWVLDSDTAELCKGLRIL